MVQYSHPSASKNLCSCGSQRWSEIKVKPVLIPFSVGSLYLSQHGPASAGGPPPFPSPIKPALGRDRDDQCPRAMPNLIRLLHNLSRVLTDRVGGVTGFPMSFESASLNCHFLLFQRITWESEARERDLCLIKGKSEVSGKKRVLGR